MEIKLGKSRLLQMFKEKEEEERRRVMMVRQDCLKQGLIERRGEGVGKVWGEGSDDNSGGSGEDYKNGIGSRYINISGTTNNLSLK